MNPLQTDFFIEGLKRESIFDILPSLFLNMIFSFTLVPPYHQSCFFSHSQWDIIIGIIIINLYSIKGREGVGKTDDKNSRSFLHDDSILNCKVTQARIEWTSNLTNKSNLLDFIITIWLDVLSLKAFPNLPYRILPIPSTSVSHLNNHSGEQSYQPSSIFQQ